MRGLESFAKKLSIDLRKEERLSSYASLKVGGPADYFAAVRDRGNLIKLYIYAVRNRIPVFVLGGGTNVLVGDKGFRGLVIKNEVFEVERVRKSKLTFLNKTDKERRDEVHWKGGFLASSDLYYEEDFDNGYIFRVSSGLSLPYLISCLLNLGFSGLEWFAGIPGTVGGAVWNNIHGAHKFFGDYVQKVSFVDKDSLKAKVVYKKHLGFSYNKSVFQSVGGLITDVWMGFPMGDKRRSLATYNTWIDRKSVQPKNSAGCTFSNISAKDKARLKLESSSTSYILDRILNLKGLSVGGASVSDNHSNFIVTKPGAKALDVATLIGNIKTVCKEKLDLELKEEIIRIGEF